MPTPSAIAHGSRGTRRRSLPSRAPRVRPVFPVTRSGLSRRCAMRSRPRRTPTPACARGRRRCLPKSRSVAASATRRSAHCNRCSRSIRATRTRERPTPTCCSTRRGRARRRRWSPAGRGTTRCCCGSCSPKHGCPTRRPITPRIARSSSRATTRRGFAATRCTRARKRAFGLRSNATPAARSISPARTGPCSASRPIFACWWMPRSRRTIVRRSPPQGNGSRRRGSRTFRSPRSLGERR